MVKQSIKYEIPRIFPALTGDWVGVWVVGDVVGIFVNTDGVEGELVGFNVGDLVGFLVGALVGVLEGFLVGDMVGEEKISENSKLVPISLGPSPTSILVPIAKFPYWLSPKHFIVS